MPTPMQQHTFRALPPVEREVIYRRYKQQQWVDIADELDLSEDQVKAIHQRAMDKLKEDVPPLPQYGPRGQKRGREHASH